MTPASRNLVVAGAGVLSLALWPVQIHTAFGLPAHPLIIHVPVIFVPLLALAALAAAFWPRLHERHGLTIAAFSVVTLASTLLAVGAGKAFMHDREKLRPFVGAMKETLSHHADSGDALRISMVLLTALLIAALFARRTPKAVQVTLRVFVALLAVNAGFWVVRTGHLGAKMAWGDERAAGAPSSSPGPGEGHHRGQDG